MSAQVCFNFIIILNKMAYNSKNVLTIYILTSGPGISFTTCNTVQYSFWVTLNLSLCDKKF